VADGTFPLLDGAGAALFGGRWNSPGGGVVYASLSYANALLEIVAHRNRARVPAGYVWVTLDVPGGVGVGRVDPAVAPGWDAPDLTVGRRLGDAWLAAARDVALIVPAKPAAPHEWNVLLNPAHPAGGWSRRRRSRWGGASGCGDSSGGAWRATAGRGTSSLPNERIAGRTASVCSSCAGSSRR
jgi:RES domain-containing protein